MSKLVVKCDYLHYSSNNILEWQECLFDDQKQPSRFYSASGRNKYFNWWFGARTKNNRQLSIRFTQELLGVPCEMIRIQHDSVFTRVDLCMDGLDKGAAIGMCQNKYSSTWESDTTTIYFGNRKSSTFERVYQKHGAWRYEIEIKPRGNNRPRLKNGLISNAYDEILCLRTEKGVKLEVVSQLTNRQKHEIDFVLFSPFIKTCDFDKSEFYSSLCSEGKLYFNFKKNEI